MRHTLAIATLVIASAAAQIASAQSLRNPTLIRTGSKAFNMNCYVNGITYPVDNAGNVWARNGYGPWFIIGELVNNGSGFVIVRTDGVTFAASCY